MLRRSYLFIGLLICCFWSLAISPAWSLEKSKESKVPKIEPQAAQVLKQMTDYLKELQQFTLQTEISEDVLLDTGLKIQDGRSTTVAVRRPNRFRVDSQGDVDDRQLFYDGKTLTFMNLSKNVYSTIDAPPERVAALSGLADFEAPRTRTSASSVESVLGTSIIMPITFLSFRA